MHRDIAEFPNRQKLGCALSFSRCLLVGAAAGIIVTTHTYTAEHSGFPYPANRLGACDEMGNASIWVENGWKIGADNEAIPFRLNFSSDQGRSHDSLLGLGWWAPLLETGVVALSDSRIRLTCLGGASVYLTRLNSEGEFQSSDANWNGHLEPGGKFTASRKDGWIYTFRDGRISTAKSPSGSLFRWRRNSDGKPFEIKDGMQGPALLSAEYGEDGLLREVRVSDKKINFHYQNVPLLGVFPGGGVSITGLEPSLSQILINRTNVATIEQGLGKDGEFYFEMNGSLGNDRMTWNPNTGIITSDSLSSYEYSDQEGVKQIFRDFGNSRRDEYVWDRNLFRQRTQINGKTETNQLSGSRGPNFLKLVKRSIVSIGEPPVEFRFQYDEHGELLRKTEINDSKIAKVTQFGDELLVKDLLGDRSMRKSSDGKAVVLEFLDGGKAGVLRFENRRLITSPER